MHRVRHAVRQEETSSGLFLPNHSHRRQQEAAQTQQFGAPGFATKHGGQQLPHDQGCPAPFDLCGAPCLEPHSLSPVACSGLSSPVPGISTPPRNGINGTLLDQLMFSNSGGAAQAHLQHQQQPSDWSGSGDLQQLMTQLPQAQQQQLLLDAMQLSTSQPMMAAQQQQQLPAAACPSEHQWMEQVMAAATGAGGSAIPNLDAALQPSTPNQHPHGLQRQWSTADSYNSAAAAAALSHEQQQLMLLQAHAAALRGAAAMPQPMAPAAGSMASAAMLQQMLQVAQAQEQQVQQQTQQLSAALALALLGQPPAAALGQQQLLLNNAAATAGMWPQLQQQQQAAAAAAAALPLLSSMAGLCPQLAGLTPGALMQNQQLSSQLLSAALPSAAAPASSAIAQLLSASLGGLVNHSSPAAAAASGKLWSGVPAVGMDAPAGSAHGRRSRRNSRNSNTVGALAPTAADLFARRDRRSSSGKDAAGGPAAGQPLSAVALLPGMQLSDLAPGSFDEYWGDETVADQRTSSDASVLSVATCCTSSSTASASTDASLVKRCDSASSSVCGSVLLSDDEPEQPAVADSWAAGQASCPAAGSADESTQAAPQVAGCPAWFPGAREASGDDSWYLPRPPTSRLFVGNIGCWVDEAALMSYFGKYGNVVDVQVMWNTKMLARGRRVNREFAFISYSSPLEAARAVHWLDGCRLPDLEKDKNGVTVEYENGESEAAAGKPAAAVTVA